ncbi:A24 family peptidase [Virgibacillus halophilus]|uniref:A24 family peptidase n=1 Tax=Tigheibacillus halophilus TaxID=361280 RepID=A0ABU5CDA1_9BACI|nr:A24 family peptidase [Virgibacillus halophilus]
MSLFQSFLFLLQKGTCRHCNSKISSIYPATELLTGFLFMYSFLIIGWQMELAVALFFISMLMIIFVSDLKYMVIENKVLLFFLPIFILLRSMQPLETWWTAMGGALLGAGIVFMIIFLSGGGMGAGDMKLFGVIGIVLGTKLVLFAFFLSCVIGAVFGIALIMLKVVQRKQPVPFGPYIISGSLVSYFYGNEILNWYFFYLLWISRNNVVHTKQTCTQCVRQRVHLNVSGK